MATVFKRGGKANRGGNWYCEWTDHEGKRRSKCAKTTDKAAAERIAAKYEADAMLRREGVIDVRVEKVAAQSRREIESHLPDYEAKMQAEGCSSDYIIDTLRMIRAMTSGVQSVAEITADSINEYAANMRTNGDSPRTIQKYLTAVKGFTKWLAKFHKLPYDPLSTVQKPNPNSDRRHERRFLLPGEWHLLKQATEAAGESYGMAGHARAMLYEAAIQTGLRSSELRSLTGARLFLDGKRPYITCKGASTKNKENARQYIGVTLASLLRAHGKGRSAKLPVFDLPPRTEMADMLRADLAVARKAWLAESPKTQADREKSDFLEPQNDAGEKLDFHSLRHTCGAWLAKAGVHPKVVQNIMRHCTITLTLDTYGHLFPGDDEDALAKLESLLNAKPEPRLNAA